MTAARAINPLPAVMFGGNDPALPRVRYAPKSPATAPPRIVFRYRSRSTLIPVDFAARGHSRLPGSAAPAGPGQSERDTAIRVTYVA